MKDFTEANAMLNDLFNVLNKKFYNGDLPILPICLTATTRSITAFNPDVTTVFERKRKQECQLNFSDDILTDPISIACTRMLHVMCHYYCYLHDIPDTSRQNTYHNKRFKKQAEKHGLIQVNDGKYGWSISNPSRELAHFCATELKGFSFGVFRYTHYKKDETIQDTDNDTIRLTLEINNPNSHSIKLTCPFCGTSIRTTKPSLKDICGNCYEESGRIVYRAR